MARRIRERDWSAHPFGEPASWPPSLCIALSICLQSKFPTAIYWGPDLRLLYNDAWAPIPGPRHPAALGSPAREVWSDIWHVIEPQFRRVVEEGEGVFLQDYLLPMQRFGQPEETYWSYSLTPIRSEDGAIVGIFNSGFETTRNVLSQRQMNFLLALGDAMRNAPDVEAARGLALQLIGKSLNADRVGLREVVGGGGKGRFPIVQEWTADGVSPAGGEVMLPGLGPDLGKTFKSGRILILNDIETDLKDDDQPRLSFAAMGVRAVIAVPKLLDGELVAILFIHSRVPRAWSLFDISTAEQVLERIWNWMERERVAERERLMIREIDHRAKNALAVVQAVIRLTLADDISSFREKIEGRVAALTRTHDLLSSKRWAPIDFRLLVEREVGVYSPIDGSRVQIAGPAVMLRSELAQTIALLLHELATNAAKHGALSALEGRLTINWRAEDGEVCLDWNETLPGVDAAKGIKAGFGSKLIKSVIERQLGGSITSHFDHGFKCRIVIPIGTEVSTEGADSAPAAERARNSDAERVLIVEDEALVALDLANMVRVLGYDSIETASNVSEALASLRKASRPVLAIVDVDLAGVSPEPVVDVLRSLGIHTVLASGHAEMEDLPPAFAGFTCLSKPIILSDFTRAIKKETARR